MRKQLIHHTLRLKFIALLTLLLVGMQGAWAQTGNWSDNQDSGYESGSGTQSDPYIIKTAGQLAYFAARVTAGNDLSSYVELAASLDLSAHWWIPIGGVSGANPTGFQGHFDGKGYTISKMTAKWGDNENAGFFSFLKGGSVKNIVFDQAHMTNTSGTLGTQSNSNGARRVGVLAAGIRNNPIIENIIVLNSKIDITKENTVQNGAWALVGGLIGGVYNSPTIRNAYVDVAIDMSNITEYNKKTYDGVEDSWFGMLIGGAENDPKGTPDIENTYIAGTLTVDEDRNFPAVGIFIGENADNGTFGSNNFYVNKPKDKAGNEITLTNNDDSHGTTGKSYEEFLNIANSYVENRNDLLKWKTESDKPFSFNQIAISVTEKFEHDQHTTSLVLTGAPAGSTITWTLDGKTVGATSGSTEGTPSLNSDKTILTIPLSTTTHIGNVTVTAGGETLEQAFTIYPKTYSTELYADSYAGGTGSKEDPYIIANDLQLAKLARDVNNSAAKEVYSKTYFKLSADIDLSCAFWTPIGTTDYNHYFAGKLDGDGHAISKMLLTWQNQARWATWGLFASLQGIGATDADCCSITNLVIDYATVEKEKDVQTVGSGSGSGVNIGILVGEVNTNVEISNIIVRNSTITDNGEAYTADYEYHQIGGVLGNIQASANTKVFNLSSDTKIQMFEKATVNSNIPGKGVFLAPAIGRCQLNAVGNFNIYPTNIYVHGAAVVTNMDANFYVGATVVTAWGANDSAQDPSAASGTWYYVNKVTGTGTNICNHGTEKSLVDFGTAFTQQNNVYLQDKDLETIKKLWVYRSTSDPYFAFSANNVTLDLDDDHTVVTPTMQPSETGNELYYWFVSRDKSTWTQMQNEDGTPILSHTLTVPSQDYDQYIYAVLADGTSTSPYIKVEALKLTVSVVKTDGTYTVKLTNNIWQDENGNSDNSKLNITYQWAKNDVAIDGATSASYTPASGSIADQDKISCHVIVTDGSGKVILDRWVYMATVVFLNPADTENADKTEDQRTSDASWGYAPEKPMLTWKGAYSKLLKEGSWDDNIIVLMGTSKEELTKNRTTGFNITPNVQGGGNLLNNTDWNTAKNSSPLFCNATITGSWGNKTYDAVIELGGASDALSIFGDTKFDYLTFKHTNYQNYDIIYCQYYNLEMGKHVKMAGYENIWSQEPYETIDGARTTPLQIFGGFNNDARFVDSDNAKNISDMEAAMPHPKGFSITLYSGFYSSICVGGHQNNNSRLNGIMGTPNLPIKCTVTLDIDREFNDANNSTSKPSNYDAGIILAGNHEGAMYADVDIIIKSGKVGRVVNGTLGNHRNTTFYYKDKTYGFPYDAYMGRANILLDPENSDNNKSEDINSRVVVTELYGGSTGRGYSGSIDIDNPFYGYSTITVKGGTFANLGTDAKKKDLIIPGIFGAGAGGKNGIGTDAIHTPDERIPYWSEDGTVILYGDYTTAKNNLVKYKCYDEETGAYTYVDPTLTHTSIIIDGGQFGTANDSIDGIYAGGSGYMSPGLFEKAKTVVPDVNGGNIYGKEGNTVSSLTINGGTFYCKHGIFAGGRGTNYYYSTDAYGANEQKDADGNVTKKANNSSYNALARIYGNVELTINGGTFHCPVFGGGYGVADAKLKDTETISTLSNMARIYGKSTVNINGGTFYKNIYGGGDMAIVENATDYATSVNVSDSADIRGSVFAGGNGRMKRLSGTTIANDTQSPELVGKVIGNTNLSFFGSAQQAPSVYGDIYGGGNLAQVQGNTNVSIYAANFAGQVFGGGNGLLNSADNTVRNSADVTGNTYITLAQDQGGQNDGEDGKKVDNFSINVIWNKMWDGTKFVDWDEENQTIFFAYGKYLNPHNIYGGGNLACKVGTYVDKDGNTTTYAQKGTGKTTVNVRKGMTPFSLLKTSEWKSAYTDNNNPHFSVFGGGYGANTTVGCTDVTVNVEGDYGIYNAEVDGSDDQLAKPNKNKKARKAASTQASDNVEMPVFDNSRGYP